MHTDRTAGTWRRRMQIAIGCAAAAALAAILGTTATHAQEQTNFKRVDVNLGGGYTFATGEVRDHLGDGYNVNVGVTFNITPNIGIQGEYAFNGLGEKRIEIPVAASPGAATVPSDFFANMNMQYGDANVILHGHGDRFRPYVVAGPGIYYRPVKVTTPSVGFVPGYCDPWWYVCVPGGFVSVDAIVGERSSTDFGINAGGGVDLMLSHDVALYIEARWHYIWGPMITNPLNNTRLDSNSQFIPITVGFRF